MSDNCEVKQKKADEDEACSAHAYEDVMAEVEEYEIYFDDSRKKAYHEHEHDSQLTATPAENKPLKALPETNALSLENDDPCRNRDIPEEDIAKRVMGAFLKEYNTALTPLEIARKITTKILKLSDVAFSDDLPIATTEMIQKATMNHGLEMDDPGLSEDIPRGIADFPFIKTITLLHQSCIHPASFDIPGTYIVCVRSVNTLKLILDAPHVGNLQKVGVKKILEKTWDVAVLLLGYGLTPSIIPRGQSLLAPQAASIAQPTGELRSAGQPSCRGISSNFLGRIPPYLAWGLSVVLFARTVGAAGQTATPDASSGILNLSTWLHLPKHIHPIVFEWAALIPLTVYLASFRSDFELAGEVSLQGRLSVGVIPKLWALGGMAKILRQGEMFFDSANAAGETLKVFDAQHGCVFPCYNSAATAAVADAVVAGDPVIKEGHLIEWINSNRENLKTEFMIAGFEGDTPKSGFIELRDSRKFYGRRQILNIIDIRRASELNGALINTKDPAVEEPRRVSKAGFRNWATNAAWFGEILLLTGATVTLFGAGCLGSGSLLFIGGISRVCAHYTKIGRPPHFLENQESYEGCMLVSIHDNAAVWTLYRGDRGLINSLLNKPMVAPFKPTRVSKVVYIWFRFAEILQVVAMTYVAGEKGWDALILLILITAVWSFSKFWGYNQHAQNWLKEEGFKATSFGCEFPGRTELVAAVQLLSTEKRTVWMNSILAPCERRTVLFQRLGALSCTLQQAQEDFNALGETDRLWVMSTWMQSKAGAALIKKELRKRNVRLPEGEES